MRGVKYLSTAENLYVVRCARFRHFSAKVSDDAGQFLEALSLLSRRELSVGTTSIHQRAPDYPGHIALQKLVSGRQ
jgi:hypothetical protein